MSVPARAKRAFELNAALREVCPSGAALLTPCIGVSAVVSSAREGTLDGFHERHDLAQVDDREHPPDFV